MLQHAYAVILAGGRGGRFWPLSTRRRPKQLLSLVGEKTLLAQAVDRLDGLIEAANIFVITNADFVEAIQEAVPAIPAGNIIGEPVGRDTAAAVALACALVKQRDPHGVFSILTADHIIGDLPRFKTTLTESIRMAGAEDILVTIGMEPGEPSTGYGYIESGAEHCRSEGITFLKAERFVEKPDQRTAEGYIASGNYFWNSGMFIWSVTSLEKAFARHRPQLAEMMQRLAPTIGTVGFMDALSGEYEQLEKISVDYALMEPAGNIVMARGTFAWDDVGAWSALENHFEPDKEGNIAVGKGRCESIAAANNIVVSDPARLTALVGVDDVVVVHTNDVTLICSKAKAQEIKKLVAKLERLGGYETFL